MNHKLMDVPACVRASFSCSLEGSISRMTGGKRGRGLHRGRPQGRGRKVMTGGF